MNMTELREAEAFLRRRLPRGGRLLVAVSGGLDSMCLLHFCLGLRGFSVTAAHFDHQLRQASQRDRRFVEEWCAAHGVPCATGTGDTRNRAKERGESLEEAARNLRYAFLEEAGADHDAILTAHHAADNAETLLLNLLRGTGGAGGIPAERGKILRPFLSVGKETLEAYAEFYAIPHVEDETNEEDGAARNVLRHHVMPILKELNPRAEENISRAAAILRSESAILEELAERAAAEGTPKALLEAPEPIAARAALLLLGRRCGGRKDLTARHARALLELCRKEGGEVHFPGGLAVRKERQTLTFYRRELPEGEVPIAPGETAGFGEWEVTLGEGAEGPFRVTAWDPSDRMTLPGSRGKRSVKRLCAERGITPRERDGLPVLRLGQTPVAMARLGTDLEFAPENDTVFVKFIHKGDRNHEK